MLLAAVILVAMCVGVLLWGCATTGRVDAIEQSVARLEADVSVGGGGDSVTAWLYALGAAVVYPVLRWARGERVFSSGGRRDG